MSGPAKVPYSETALFRQRHSAAHILAQAVVELFPGTKLGAGPPTEDGFYYDFELPRPLTDEDLPRIGGSSRISRTSSRSFKRSSVARSIPTVTKPTTATSCSRPTGTVNSKTCAAARTSVGRARSTPTHLR